MNYVLHQKQNARDVQFHLQTRYCDKQKACLLYTSDAADEL